MRHNLTDTFQDLFILSSPTPSAFAQGVLLTNHACNQSTQHTFTSTLLASQKSTTNEKR